MSTKQPKGHRRSIVLVPEIKDSADAIAQAKGISVNRAIEKAVGFYRDCLDAEQARHGRMVSINIVTPNGHKDEVHITGTR